jgi:ribosomal protein S27E
MNDKKPNAEERTVHCPNCKLRIGTTSDGKSLKAELGAVLSGKAAELHTTVGVIDAVVEGHGRVEVGCRKCGDTFTVTEALYNVEAEEADARVEGLE